MWIQLTSDRKRFGALCAAVAIGMLLWARLIVVSRMPRTAVADKPLASAGNSSTAGNAEASAESIDAAPGLSGEHGAAQGRQPQRIELALDVRRDPFVISPRYFPKPTLTVELPQQAGKSQVKPAEESQQIEARITAQLKAMAERMRLEAALAGSMAVIDGKTYRSGDWIEGAGEQTEGNPVRFRLVEVKQRSAILECEGRRFELQMTTPGA